MNSRALRVLILTLLPSLLFLGSCSANSKEENLKAPLTQPNTSYTKPPYSATPPSKVTWNSGRKDLKHLALTFDDGPHPQNTPRLLDMLKARGVKATFYTIGRSVDLYPEITKRIVEEGHEIGNHTYTHGNLSKMSESKVRQELDRGRDAIVRATGGYTPVTMRPPYGALYTNQRAWIRDQYGYPTILWSVDPLDWKNRNASIVASRLIKGASPGGILLAHDLHKTTVDAMPRTLDTLLSQGYEFVTVSEMIQLSKE